jgi:hypothetical protein
MFKDIVQEKKIKSWILYINNLSAFAKLWKATISFVISVCTSFRLSFCLPVYPSLRMEHLGYQTTDF